MITLILTTGLGGIEKSWVRGDAFHCADGAEAVRLHRAGFGTVKPGDEDAFAAAELEFEAAQETMNQSGDGKQAAEDQGSEGKVSDTASASAQASDKGRR